MSEVVCVCSFKFVYKCMNEGKSVFVTYETERVSLLFRVCVFGVYVCVHVCTFVYRCVRG